MKRLLAILLVALLLLLSLGFVACDGEEDDIDDGVVSYDNPEDGTFGVDFGELFGSEE